jgi:hypothetical protein
MTHPYWTTATIGIGIVAVSVVVLIACLARWAWIKGNHAADQRRWDQTTHIDWDQVIARILTERGQP